MSTPADGVRLVLTVLFAAWVLAFFYAFVAYTTAPYEGAGFPDGLNKPAVFLGWQGVAGVLAVAVFGVSRRWPRGRAVRKLGTVPLGIALVLALAVVGIGILAEGV